MRMDEIERSAVGTHILQIGQRQGGQGEFGERQSALANAGGKRRVGGRQEHLLAAARAQSFHEPEDLLLAAAPSRAGVNMENPHCTTPNSKS
jgi:hypothetical protein